MPRPPEMVQHTTDVDLTDERDAAHQRHDDVSAGGMHMSWGRFAAMIGTSTLVMFGLMYLNTYVLDHVRWSETRAWMALLMGASMAVIMLGYMWGSYRGRAIKVGVVVVALGVFAGSLALVRSQTTVDDTAYMRAMIPHHSIAILTSTRAGIQDVRVRDLADGIIEAQRREIREMDWLIDDIAANGPATSRADAQDRPVPDFSGDREGR